ncbi:MAG: N-acetylmuramoyl-L-alanine amidase, partial [Paracoccaceae bacterium]
MRWVLALAVSLMMGGPVVAQDLTALARLDAASSAIADQAQEQGQGVAVTLALSQPVPWRVRVLDAPPRLVLDMREVDWTGVQDVPRSSAAVLGLRAGVFRPGWSRLVLELAEPMLVAEAEMVTKTGAVLRLRLEPSSQADFAAAAALPEPADWALPEAAMLAAPKKRGDGPLIVVLDPGHGGIDPGAERDGFTEAALMLGFARELKELLLRDG